MYENELINIIIVAKRLKAEWQFTVAELVLFCHLAAANWKRNTGKYMVDISHCYLILIKFVHLERRAEHPIPNLTTKTPTHAGPTDDVQKQKNKMFYQNIRI